MTTATNTPNNEHLFHQCDLGRADVFCKEDYEWQDLYWAEQLFYHLRHTDYEISPMVARSLVSEGNEEIWLSEHDILMNSKNFTLEDKKRDLSYERDGFEELITGHWMDLLKRNPHAVYDALDVELTISGIESTPWLNETSVGMINDLLVIVLNDIRVRRIAREERWNKVCKE